MLTFGDASSAAGGGILARPPRQDSMRTARLLFALIFCTGIAACAASTSSGPSFTLPEGDVAAGKKVFVQSQCSFCHAVEGVDDLPAPVAEPPVPFSLGSETNRMTDGEIVTSIIDPSHFVSPEYPDAQTQMGDESRMPAYRNTLSVQQLIDLVAFLRSAQ